MNKRRNTHLVKNPEIEIQEKETQIKSLDKKLQYTWNQLREIGCEIDNPFSLNFIIKNRKANRLEKRLQDITAFLNFNSDISEKTKQKLMKLAEIK